MYIMIASKEEARNLRRSAGVVVVVVEELEQGKRMEEIDVTVF